MSDHRSDPVLLLRHRLDHLGLSPSDLARALGVRKRKLKRLLAGEVPFDARLALRLERALGTEAREWMLAQMERDLRIAGVRDALRLQRIPRATSRAARRASGQRAAPSTRRIDKPPTPPDAASAQATRR